MAENKQENDGFRIKILPEEFSVCKLNREASINHQLFLKPNSFFSFTRTDDELSIVCKSCDVEKLCDDKNIIIIAEDSMRALKIDAVLSFDLIGVLSEISGILAKEEISIFVISTYDTDYILVSKDALESAKTALSMNQYQIIEK